MFKNDMPKIGVDLTFVLGTDLDEVKAALTSKTKLVWFEPCTNPTVTMVDIAAITRVVKEFNKDILIVVDNTFLSPYAYVSNKQSWPTFT